MNPPEGYVDFTVRKVRLLKPIMGNGRKHPQFPIGTIMDAMSLTATETKIGIFGAGGGAVYRQFAQEGVDFEWVKKDVVDEIVDFIGNTPIQFGLAAQSKIPIVEKMLADGSTWDEIGKAIGWDGETAKRFYGYHLEDKDKL